ncbi:MAG: DapH/DapD/GlmU-related protein [Syntrophorhabdus sp.]
MSVASYIDTMNFIENNIDNYLSRIGNTQSYSGQPVKAQAGKAQPGRNVSIDPSCDMRGIDKMLFGHNVVIQKDCWLNIAYDNPDSHHIIQIGDGTNIGRRCTISGANSIILGKNVLLGPNVFIADTSHEYRHAGRPIMDQGITTHNDRVFIGDGTWIGTNSVIVGNVTIGRNSVIGANSIVNRDIPDYCVAAGNPCRIRKIFDIQSGTWKEITESDDLEYQLSQRGDLLDYIVPLKDLKFLTIDARVLTGDILNEIRSIGVSRLTVIVDDTVSRNEQERKRIEGLTGPFGTGFSVCTVLSRLKCPGIPACVQLFIDRQGDVFPCHARTGVQATLGNIHESGIDTIWNKAPVLRQRKILGDAPCSSCHNQE